MRHPSVLARTAVVTGASSGVGRGVALALAARGTRVVVASRDAEALRALSAQVAARGGQAAAMPVDVTDPVAVDHLAADAEAEFGPVDLWVHTVGVLALGSFWDVPTDVHARVIEVNVTGTVSCAHAAIGHFRRNGAGTFVVVGSVEGEIPLAGHASYAASKAAIDALIRAIHQDLRLSDSGRRIHVASVHPWALDTPLWTGAANRSGHAGRMWAMQDPRPTVRAVLEVCARPRLARRVGWRSRVAAAAHRLAPRLTDRTASDVAARELRWGAPAPDTDGILSRPPTGGRSVDGGIRGRMRREDAAHHRSAPSSAHERRDV